ncbi:MAG TPA: hypothetical protein VIV58_08445 [Kofleriaceae bacterium]
MDDVDARIGFAEQELETRTIAYEGDVDVTLANRTQRAFDFWRGRTIAAHRIDYNPRTHVPSLVEAYSSAVFLAVTCSPLYWPHDMHTRCGTRGAPQLGHA